MTNFEIMYEGPSDRFGPSKVLGGPYGKKEAEKLMADLSSVHTDDSYWLVEVA